MAESLEHLVRASVALTARVLGEVAPDLTFLQWRALVILGSPGDSNGTSIGALASALAMSVSATSRVVRRLESRGLLDGSRSASDRRVRLVRLSPVGQGLFDEVMERRRIALVQVAADIEPGDRQVIDRVARSFSDGSQAVRSRSFGVLRRT
ncbi:MAG TPA: MarR family transcriptional regulator [Candidatus Binatus sp.]|nr:MarR family transcriptional regulator [Candidatus Binatus sp.]